MNTVESTTVDTGKNSRENVQTGVNESYKDLGILEKMKEEKEKRKKGKTMDDDAVSTDSASKTLMSRHAMKMFFYTINLGIIRCLRFLVENSAQ